MYDKVKLWIDRAIVGDNFPTIANYLDSARQETYLQTGEVKTFGSLQGLKVSIFVGGLSVVGSLAKYLYDGSNVYSLDRHTTSTAIEKLEDVLHISIGQAAVTGVEFGTNFLMKYPVGSYLQRLGEMSRFKRLQVTDYSLRYEGSGKKRPKVFAFYDKIADATAKEMDFPDDMKEKHLLRYEMRLTGRLPHQLGVPEVKASTLTEKSFYSMMIERYQNYYFSISKQNKVKTDIMSEIKTVSDAYSVFIARLISQTDQSQIVDFLEELKDAKVFKDKKYYTRLKKKIQEVATISNIKVCDELIRELDNEIKNCGAYV